MKRVEVPSYPVSIFIAGRANDIEDQCRAYCDEVGLCVTCTPTVFVYTGGKQYDAEAVEAKWERQVTRALSTPSVTQPSGGEG